MAAVFDRWHHALLYSGPFLVYKQYYEELNRYYWASYSAHRLTYKGMQAMGITWADNPDRESGGQELLYTMKEYKA